MPSPARLQEYGVGIFPEAATKSSWKKLLKKGYVLVDGSAGTTATLVQGGEKIELLIPEEVLPKKQFVFPLQVLFEDEYLALVHKPAGILVSGNSFKTIAQALPQNLQPSPMPDAVRPQPVHRLDYATTGVLLVGKTRSAIHSLNQLFEQREVHKTYLAICIGEIGEEGDIDLPVDGKSAKSEFKRLDTVVSGRFGCLNLVCLIPHTGRRHQLRIHLASQGNPILGDKDYGIEGFILNGKGLYLHAYSLEFDHPFSAERLSIKSELPERFQKIFPEYEKALH